MSLYELQVDYAERLEELERQYQEDRARLQEDLYDETLYRVGVGLDVHYVTSNGTRVDVVDDPDTVYCAYCGRQLKNPDCCDACGAPARSAQGDGELTLGPDSPMLVSVPIKACLDLITHTEGTMNPVSKQTLSANDRAVLTIIRVAYWIAVASIMMTLIGGGLLLLWVFMN